MTSLEFAKMIEAEAKARNMKPGALCKRAVDNYNLYGALLGGKTCTLDTADAIKKWLEANPAPSEQDQITAPSEAAE